MQIGSDHILCFIPGQPFQGLIPVGNDMVLINNEGGNGTALNDLRKRSLSSDALLFRFPPFGDIFVAGNDRSFFQTLADPGRPYHAGNISPILSPAGKLVSKRAMFLQSLIKKCPYFLVIFIFPVNNLGALTD